MTRSPLDRRCAAWIVAVFLSLGLAACKSSQDLVEPDTTAITESATDATGNSETAPPTSTLTVDTTAVIETIETLAASTVPTTTVPTTTVPPTEPPTTAPTTIASLTSVAPTIPTIPTIAPPVAAAQPSFDPSTAVSLVPADVSATCQSADGAEADGTPVPFQPSNLFDFDVRTAWRCDAPAISQSVTMTLPTEAHLTSVGLVPGYDKIDPTSAVDRFLENFRVHIVRWSFDDGTSTTQTFLDARDMQSIGVDSTTSHVTMTILAVYDSSYAPGDPHRREFVPISEMQLTGIVLD